jgi:glutathione synthase/RimK-type ligase-like ATP-grasp enzyme
MKKSSPQIVVITDRQDAHVPMVQKHTNIPMTILDPQALLEGITCTFELERKKMVVTYNRVRLDNVVGVWYRKPTIITDDQLPVAAELKPYVLSSIHRHNSLLYSSFHNARWLSDYYAMSRAEDKSWQLEMAAKLGFNVPGTLMTSDPAAARAFINTHHATVVKSYAAYSPGAARLQKGFLTTRINKQSLPDLTNLYLTPSIFQEAVETAFDVRVTVVDNEVFAAKISNDSLDDSSPVLDWRIGHSQGDMRIESYELPQKTERQCVALIKALGLSYGAIDLVMDKQGQLWFLENNSNGQWGFVEIETGQPIGKAIARFLTGLAGL